MTEIDRRRPDLAPETMHSADGSTTLKRYRAEAVIYAPSRRIAERELGFADLYLNASRIVGGHEAQVKLRDGDHPVCTLSPDAVMVTDASNCIVLVTPERRVTVTNVQAWKDTLDRAKECQVIYDTPEAGQQS